MLVTTYNEFSVVTTGGVETYISDSTDASISFDGISADYVAPSTTKPSFGGILLL